MRTRIAGAGGVVAMALTAAATAWACTAAGGPYVSDLVPSRTPVGAMAEIKGGGWLASQQVQVGWQAADAGEIVPLATTSTDGTGAFKVGVKVPDAPLGLNYVAVVQGKTTKVMPFEVVGDGAQTAAVPIGTDAGSKLPSGSEAAASGLSDIPGAGHSGSSSLPLIAASAVGVLALAAVTVTELRRRQVKARR